MNKWFRIQKWNTRCDLFSYVHNTYFYYEFNNELIFHIFLYLTLAAVFSLLQIMILDMKQNGWNTAGSI